jgi:hypothetical protein
VSMAGWRGGPLSNNNALPGGDYGVYEAIATMTNGTGLYRFAVRNNGADSQAAFGGTTGPAGITSSNVQFSAGLLNAQSSHVWYYKGITYYGVALGSANHDMGIVSATGNATNNIPEPLVTSNGVVINGSTGNNIGFANSNFIAKFRDKGPAFRFSGTGQVSFTGNADVVASVEAINPVTVAEGGIFTPVDGIGAGNDLDPGAFNNVTSQNVASTVTSPGGGSATLTARAGTSESSFSSNTRVGTGGEDGDFVQRGHVRKFVVFGTKVSHIVAP